MISRQPLIQARRQQKRLPTITPRSSATSQHRLDAVGRHSRLMQQPPWKGGGAVPSVVGRWTRWRIRSRASATTHKRTQRAARGSFGGPRLLVRRCHRHAQAHIPLARAAGRRLPPRAHHDRAAPLGLRAGSSAWGLSQTG
jgi:hypothetical protein